MGVHGSPPNRPRDLHAGGGKEKRSSLRSFGIDPGAEGAISVLDVDGACLFCRYLPILTTKNGPMLDLGEFISIIIAFSVPMGARAFVEKAQPFPKNGAVSSFRYGFLYGQILAGLAFQEIETHLIPPGTWKKSLGLSKSKDDSLELVRRLFPEVLFKFKKDHNRAESLLIAHYGFDGFDFNAKGKK